MISIIIPCYNAEKYIDRCFKSLLSQTLGTENMEIIFIDDASTDNTWCILEKLEQQYPELVMIVHCDINGRQGTARNIGMSYASGEYITFIDVDDWIDDDMLECLYVPMTTHDYDFTMCGYWRDRGEDAIEVYPKKEGVQDKHFIIDSIEKRGTFIMCMSLGSLCVAKLYNRDFLISNNIVFAEGIVYEDRMFMALLYMYARDFLIIDNRCYHYWWNTESTVLKNDVEHHSDTITVDNLWWNECKNRGFLDVLKDEIEVYFLLLGYIPPLKNISFKYDEPPYEMYLQLRESVISKVSNYKNNPYIREYATDFNYALLETLSVQLSKDELRSVCKAIRIKDSNVYT